MTSNCQINFVDMIASDSEDTVDQLLVAAVDCIQCREHGQGGTSSSSHSSLLQHFNCEIHGQCNHLSEDCPQRAGLQNSKVTKGNPRKRPTASKTTKSKKRKTTVESEGDDDNDSDAEENNINEVDGEENLGRKDFIEAYDDPEEEAEPPQPNILLWEPFNIEPIEPERTRNAVPKRSVELFPRYHGRRRGSQVGNLNLTAPSDYMELFWDSTIIQTFCAETNSWARNNHVRGWRDVEREEMKGFWAMILFLGVMKLPERRLAWENPVFSSQFCQTSMSYARFESILKALHWLDASEVTAGERSKRNKENPFWTVQSFVDHLASRYKACYQLGQCSDVDEICIAFKGRHRCKCYNPSKPNKWHFKAFGLNCAETSYLWNFFLYHGRDEKRPSGVTATEYPVLKLLEDEEFNYQDHVVATDNWYTSVNLAMKLQHRGIHSIGTIRTNKALIPKQAIIPKKGPGKKERGYMHTWVAKYEPMVGHRLIKSKLFFTGWQDTKPVHLLSTFPVSETSVERHSIIDGKHSKVTITCPTCIPQYNASMGGTDRHDQLTSYYTTTVNTKRWQTKILFHFLHTSVVNAHIIYKMEHETARGMPNYRLLDFIQSICGAWKVARADQDRHSAHLTAEKYSYAVKVGSHIPYYFHSYRDPVTKKQTNYRRKCVECNKEGIQMGCMQCNRALCMAAHKDDDPESTCWGKFHKRQRESAFQ